MQSLNGLVATHARRRSEDPVPPDVLVRARRLINDARKVLSRETGAGLYLLSPEPVWSELYAVLQLALAALADFVRRNQPSSPEMQILRRQIRDRIERLNQG